MWVIMVGEKLEVRGGEGRGTKKEEEEKEEQEEQEEQEEEGANMTSKRSLKSDECSGGVTIRSAIMPCKV